MSLEAAKYLIEFFSDWHFFILWFLIASWGAFS